MLPAAIASTLVTNPVTFAPVYLLAYQVGAALLGTDAGTQAPPVPGAEPAAIQPAAIPDEVGWVRSMVANVLALGKPLLLGLALFAVSAGVLTYALIMIGWRLRTTWNWKRRRRRDAQGL